jgi:Protein of unknown function (DUF2877)
MMENGHMLLPASTLTADSFHAGILAFSGKLTVRAVFERAWHLESERNFIITITTVPHDGPLTVRMDGSSLSSLGVHPADSGAIWSTSSGPVIVIGRVSIALPTTRRWQPEHISTTPVLSSRLRIDLKRLIARSNDAARGGLAAGILTADESPGAPAWLRHGAKSARGLMHALQIHDQPAIRGHTRGLIGLGPGLTPSGDDLLCGLLAGLRILDDRPGLRCSSAQANLALIDRTVAEAQTRTTLLSRTLLHYAAQGVATEPLLRVLWALGSGLGIADVDHVLGIGHSSGSDMLTGAVLAATAVLAWEDAIAPALVSSA